MSIDIKNSAASLPSRIASDLEMRLLEFGEKMHIKAVTDELTGLPNRRGWNMELEKRRLSRHPMMVMFIDLDDFKSINDKNDHAVGDESIVAATKLIQACIRPDDILARIGGDEFAILVDVGTMEYKDLVNILTERFDQISAEYNQHNPINIKFSYGSAFSTQSPHNLKKIMKESDRSMYQMKKQRKDKLKTDQIPV